MAMFFFVVKQRAQVTHRNALLSSSSSLAVAIAASISASGLIYCGIRCLTTTTITLFYSSCLRSSYRTRSKIAYILLAGPAAGRLALFSSAPSFLFFSHIHNLALLSLTPSAARSCERFVHL
jgi:hypothetical protein